MRIFLLALVVVAGCSPDSREVNDDNLTASPVSIQSDTDELTTEQKQALVDKCIPVPGFNEEPCEPDVEPPAESVN